MPPEELKHTAQIHESTLFNDELEASVENVESFEDERKFFEVKE